MIDIVSINITLKLLNEYLYKPLLKKELAYLGFNLIESSYMSIAYSYLHKL